MNTEEKFWLKVDKNGPIPIKFPHLGPCWVWTAGRSDTGYGMFQDVDTKKRLNAHRYSWTLHNGPVPNGLYVLHHCDVRECVRPDHLFVGTQKQNIHDALEKGNLAPQQETFKRLWREKWQGVRCGANIHCSKLTESDVREIKKLYGSNGWTYDTLGEKFGISFGSVRDIIKGTSWSHVK